MSAIFMGYLQAQECSTTAIGVSYVAPKGASIDVITTGKFQGGIGLVYNPLTTKEKGNTGESYDISILAFGGVRVYHREYRTAVYTNIGYAFSSIFGANLFVSGKLMLLRNQKAFFLEPYYCNKPGVRLGIYKLI